ncbi:Kelch repeat-containing protein [Archangium lipolyticum]|uniref:hypothetical protein n=1 Tax=Archangium lipolyticum TaxID=2970465 RepID=UPI002149E653|nr:hypothetical protein [Archangium lipolyticum]
MNTWKPKGMRMLWVLALLAVGCPRPQVTPSEVPATTTPTTGPEDAGTADAGTPQAAPPAPVPYSLAFTGHLLEGFTGVHSAAYAVHEGKLVVIGGRANGMHNFPLNSQQVKTRPAFPPSQANASVWVIDLAAGKVLGSKSTDALPAKIRTQWRATNPQSLVLNGHFIIAGGYGQNPAGTSMVTQAYATSVGLDALIQAVLDPQAKLDTAWASQNVGIADNLALQVTGGELVSLGGLQLLVFGHTFNGEYTSSGSLATQTYTESVRMFRFTPGSQNGKATLAVQFLGQTPNVPSGQQDPEGPYHRRDLTVGPTRTGTGDLRITAYSGVFKGGRMEGYLNPVYISPDTTDGGITLDVDTSAEQLLNHYACPAIPIFDAASRTMYTTLVGGISYYSWDGTGLKHDPGNLPGGVDGLPFINSVSTLRVSYADGQRRTQQYLHPELTFPPADAQPRCGSTPATLGGTGGIFIPDDALGAAVRNGVLDYGGLPASGRIGWVFGGIAATASYGAQGPSCASNMLYEVTLTRQPGQLVELHPPAR